MTGVDVITGLDQLSGRDQVAIGTTLSRLFADIDDQDAHLLAGVYSGDADRVDAFGRARKGGPQIAEFLDRQLIKIDCAETSIDPRTVLRRLTCDVVTVFTHRQFATAHHHALRILQRGPDGRWLIVSELCSAIGPHLSLSPRN